jgi:hypothetical protein
MTKFQNFLFFLIVTIGLGIFLVSCNDELEVNAEWKEVPVVYGLLDLTSNTQQIKVIKSYQNNASTDALSIAQNSDSLYYGEEGIVTIEELINGSVTNQYQFNRVVSNLKDSGVFSNETNVYYESPANFAPKNNAIYRLIFKNEQTGLTAISSTVMVDSTTLVFPRVQTTTINPAATEESNISFQWTTAPNARYYDLRLRFFYTEYNVNNPNDKVTKSLTQPLFEYRTTENLEGLRTMNHIYKGLDFYNFLADNIEVNDDLRRKFEYLELELGAGGVELYNYVQVNRPTTGIIQKRPEYSNIENGVGIFSSKSVRIRKLGLSQQALDDLLSYPPTKLLNFTR